MNKSLTKFGILAFCTGFVLTNSGCQKESKNTNNDATELKDANVDERFGWSTGRASTFNVQLNTNADCTPNDAPGLKTMAMLIDEDNNLIATTYLDAAKQATFDVVLASSVKEVYFYVPQYGAFEKLTGTNATVNVSCSDPGNTIPAELIGRYSAKRTAGTSTAAAPSCTAGRVVSSVANGKSLDINGGELVTFTGTYNGNVNFKAVNGNNVTGTLVICGSVNGSVSMSNNVGHQIIVNTGGSLTTSSYLNFNYENDQLINFGTLNITGGVSASKDKNIIENNGTATINQLTMNNGTLSNSGTLIVNTGFSINTTKEFVNSGTFNAKANLTLNSNTKITNSGVLTVATDLTNNAFLVNNKNSTLTIGGSLTLNSSSKLNNFCKITIGKDFSVNSTTINNESYIKAEGKVTFNSGAILNAGAVSIIICKDMDMNGLKATSYGSNTGFKIANRTVINSGNSITGPFDITDTFKGSGANSKNIEVQNQTFGANVVYGQTTVQAGTATSCLPEGMGKQIIDTDGDGVADGDDAEPKDATVAYVTTYPTKGYVFNAYEDLWPFTGDYDFNDVVIAYRVTYKRSSTNKYKTADISLVLQGVGSGLHNGLGVQFVGATAGVNGAKVISRTSGNFIQSTTGKAEAVENNAGNVVRVFTDIYKAQTKYYNNAGDGPANAKPDTLKFTVNFNQAATQPSGTMYTDFFLFNSKDRSAEIHLPNCPPTDLANQKTLGTGQDNSVLSESRFYKTKKNQPWGIEIAVGETFRHPLSKIAIDQAYPDFIKWVNSNGASFTDWYKRPNTSKVFNY